jgi:glycosyltransferase involved in cell wall biosynthesis
LFDGENLPQEEGSFVSKRICMVTHSFYESDNRIIRYAESLALRGDDVHVVCLRRSLDQPIAEMSNGVQVHRIQDRRGKREGTRWSFLWPLIRFTWLSSCWLMAHGHPRFDVIHVHNIPDFLVFATWHARLRGSRVILDIHDIIPEFFASKFGVASSSAIVRALLLMEKLSASMADRIILANHLWLDKYTSRSAPPEKCTAFINHVDECVFRPIPRRRTGSEKVIIFPGGLQWHQGLDIAIRAFALLRQRVADLRFDIYGDGNMKPQLVALVAELGLEEQVRFHEPVRLTEIAQVMADADLGVVPKRADSFGNEAYSTKIMEFMAVGVPVVVSSTRVDRHYFDDSVVRFFSSGDEVALADAMHEVLSDSAGREAMVERARDYVRRHGWSRHKASYLELVDSLADRRDLPAVDRA